MSVILYSTDCPRCKVLEKKLEQKNIKFEINKNVEEINTIAEQFGFSSAPLLMVDDQVMEFGQANTYINNFNPEKV